MDLIPGLQSSASALHAERVRMEVISQNIANANTTRTEEGGGGCAVPSAIGAFRHNVEKPYDVQQRRRQ